jgi:hypothetical protein
MHRNTLPKQKFNNVYEFEIKIKHLDFETLNIDMHESYVVLQIFVMV